MAKKKAFKKSGSNKRKKSRASSCSSPPSDAPYELIPIVGKMVKDSSFADFIHGLLKAFAKGDATAKSCLEKFYKPRKAELDAICIPPGEQKSRCTDNGHYIAAVAYSSRKRRKRK